MAKTTAEKAIELYSKVPDESLLDEWAILEQYFSERLFKYQELLQNKASEVQSKIERLTAKNQ